MSVTDTELREPPKVSGGEGPEGHLQELRDDPCLAEANCPFYD